MPEEPAKALGNLVRRSREELGLSIREVARRSGVRDTTVMRIEQAAKANPRPETLKAIADTLGLDLADVFATIGYVQADGLPSFAPYLRTKYGAMPEAAQRELEAYFAKLAKQHGLSGHETAGPADGEDEADE